MNLRERIAFWMLATSLLSWCAVIAITPVGGWCDSNIHHQDYKTAFAVSSVMVLISIGVLMYNFNKSSNEK